MVTCRWCGRVFGTLRDHRCVEHRSYPSVSEGVQSALAELGAIDAELRALTQRKPLLAGERQRVETLRIARQAAEATMGQVSEVLSDCRRHAGDGRYAAGATGQSWAYTQRSSPHDTELCTLGAGIGMPTWPAAWAEEHAAKRRAQERVAAKLAEADAAARRLKSLTATERRASVSAASERLRLVYQDAQLAHAHWTPGAGGASTRQAIIQSNEPGEPIVTTVTCQ